MRRQNTSVLEGGNANVIEKIYGEAFIEWDHTYAISERNGFFLMPVLCMSALVCTEIKSLTYKSLSGGGNANYRIPRDVIEEIKMSDTSEVLPNSVFPFHCFPSFVASYPEWLSLLTSTITTRHHPAISPPHSSFPYFRQSNMWGEQIYQGTMCVTSRWLCESEIWLIKGFVSEKAA